MTPADPKNQLQQAQRALGRLDALKNRQKELLRSARQLQKEILSLIDEAKMKKMRGRISSVTS